jgi:flagellin
MVINNNIGALNTLNKLNANSSATTQALERLSSGLKINRAADDAAGLAISQKMLAQINGLNKATENSENGISLIQTAEGALSETQSILQRMNELAVQAANGTNSDTDKSKLQDEVVQLKQAVNDIASQTKFNDSQILTTLFDGTGISLQVGAFSGENLVLKVTDSAETVDASGLSIDTVDLSTNASNAITSIKSAIDTVSNYRSKLGAYQNQLTHTINNLKTESENLSSAKSRITDVDMAAEMTEYTKNNILVQSSEAMLAQANQLPQGVLSLLK